MQPQHKINAHGYRVLDESQTDTGGLKMARFYVGKQDKEVCLSCELDACKPTSVLCPLYNDRDESMETRLLIIELIKEKAADKRTRDAIRAEIDRVREMADGTADQFNKQRAKNEIGRLKLLEKNYQHKIKSLSATNIAHKMEVPLSTVTAIERTGKSIREKEWGIRGSTR